jgi:hypothetical protein
MLLKADLIMSNLVSITLSHEELSLLLFTLEGPKAAESMPGIDSCEEACPIIESIEETLCGYEISRETQLSRHLNNHLREALIECGLFELIAATGTGTQKALTPEELARLQSANERLNSWNCQINLEDADRRVLFESLSKLPRSAWVTMPRTLWRLRKKLKR